MQASREVGDPQPADRSDAVSPVELFFDLIFVFAVSQLSSHLRDHLSWRGAGETAVMLTAVFGVWSYTSFEATLVRVRHPETRWMLLAVTALALFMNAAIGGAFGGLSWAFVAPFLVIQIGRPLWTVATSPARLREHYVRMLGWILATCPLWIAGALAQPEIRLAWWAVAAVIDLLGSWLAHPVPGRVLRSENVEFDAAHLIERCRLFLIIALGEAVFTTGAAISAAGAERPVTWLTGCCGLVTAVALWALYFAGSDHLVNRHVERTRDPILAGRLTMSSEGFVVAGLIALATGNQLVIAHPFAATSPPLILVLFGGPLLYLIAQTAYLWVVTGQPSVPRLAGVVALAVAAGASAFVPSLAAGVLVAVTLAALVSAVLWAERGRDEPTTAKEAG